MQLKEIPYYLKLSILMLLTQFQVLVVFGTKLKPTAPKIVPAPSVTASKTIDSGRVETIKFHLHFWIKAPKKGEVCPIRNKNYYSFGQELPQPYATLSNSDYRYGFNGYENDEDFTSTPSHINFGARIYDARIGKMLSRDPLAPKFPYWSPYNFGGANNPIRFVDYDGKGPILAFLKKRMKGQGYWANFAVSFAGNYMENQVKATNPLNPIGPYQQMKNVYDKFANFGDNWDKDRAMLAIATDKTARDNFIKVMKEVLGDEVATFLGENGDDSQGFQHGTILYNLAESVIGGAALLKATKGISFGEATAQQLKNMALGGMCFVAGTKVHLNSGLANIEDVIVGDSVWSFVTNTGAQEICVVEEVFVTDSVTTLIRLVIGEETILTTPDHPFFIEGEWVTADSLKIGQEVTLKYSDDVRLAVGRKEIIDTLVTVYNFRVAKNHNYFVTESGILVHNNNCAQGLKNIVKGGKKLPMGVPSLKKAKFDWDHIFDRHSDWGEVAKQSGKKDIFEGLNESQIKEVVQGAYQNIYKHKKSKTQEGITVMRGKYQSWDVEFYVNRDTKIVETAYPKGRRQ